MKKLSVTLFIQLSSFIVVITAAKAFAQELFVHSPSMSTQEFKKFLVSERKTDFKSFILGQQYLQNLNRLPISADPLQLRKALAMLQSEPMLGAEIDIAINIFEKIGVENLTAEEKLRYLALLMSIESSAEKRGIVATSSTQSVSNSLLQSLSLSATKIWLQKEDLRFLNNYLGSEDSVILVDGMVLTASESQLSNLPHQWIYLSNSTWPVVILGSLADFSLALANMKLMSETCGENVNPWPGIPEVKITNLGAHGECWTTKMSSLGNTGTSFAEAPKLERNSPYLWMVPVGIIGAGAALAYFRNKQVSFHFPTFKF